jgi:phosphoglycerate kinase
MDDKGVILDDIRIKNTIPTIEYLISKEAKVILMSHLDDPEGKVVESLRLAPIQDKLFEYLDLSILRAPDCIGKKVEEMTKDLKAGEILLLENLRFHEGEKKNDEKFAKDLACLGDIFVNDAFGASHREHASIVGLPKYLPAYAGLLLEKEVATLKKVLEKPERPLIGVFGGVKMETKLPIIKKFLDVADYVLVGGKISEEVKFSNPKLSVAKNKEHGFDINDESINKFKDVIKKAATIVWNGPLGYFEKPEYETGTKETAEAIAESSAFKVIGGGETLFAASKYNLRDKIDFLSTGGGAMLEFLAEEKLPGLDSIL